MKTQTNELVTFHLTGERPKGAKSDPPALKLRPALLNSYRDLSKLRYDYPLVLIEGDTAKPVRSLSSVVDSILQRCAPKGIAGERMRKNLLSLEREIRALASQGRPGSLSEVWGQAAGHLLSGQGLSSEDKERLEQNLDKARGVLGFDGQVLSCDGNTPVVVLTHAWKAIQQKRSRSVRSELREILIKLSDILKSDYMRSNDARTPEALKLTVGTSFEDEFDFQAMSKALPKVEVKELLPKKRRERIGFAISVLESQEFFGPEQDERVYSFEAKSCTEALNEFRKRLPKMVDFVKAIRIAELEVENAYREEKHDKLFAQLNEESLGADDIGLFPSYLVCMNDTDYNDSNKAALIEILSSELPIKVLFETSEVFDNSSPMNAGAAGSGWTLGLANMAMSLGSAFVLQTTSSNLYQMSESISEGLEGRGPALFSVFSGSGSKSRGLPQYLVAASATQSRAFPTLLYNPRAGSDWASRCSVAANPQLERVWPVAEFFYQDEELQGVSEEIAFTFVDHIATDERFSDNFMDVPKGEWNQQMVPMSEHLDDQEGRRPGQIPYILMVDEDNTLHRVIVKKSLVKAAMRCADSWCRLRELGGVGNSHALRLLESERQAWEEAKQKEIEGLRSEVEGRAGKQVVETAGAAEAVAEAEPEEEIEEISPDVPYIETARCSTCNECTNRNNKMFMYNENKQAYIADLSAGTYRQMVEAAEACKLAIIHPGKPWNMDEPNLEELMKRAEPFI